jgi:hypothetical protein|tara:strand:- start:988 stop:1230 length:243 start_codon:yes stop_codon:yes gene_type:complete
LATPTTEELHTIKSDHAKRIFIYQDVSERGVMTYLLMHKKSYFHKASFKEVPKQFRKRKTFDAAERAALELLVNYKKYFK